MPKTSDSTAAKSKPIINSPAKHMTTKEVAHLLGCGEATTRQLADDGLIASFKDSNGDRCYDRGEVMLYYNFLKMKTSYRAGKESAKAFAQQTAEARARRTKV